MGGHISPIMGGQPQIWPISGGGATPKKGLPPQKIGVGGQHFKKMRQWACFAPPLPPHDYFRRPHMKPVIDRHRPRTVVDFKPLGKIDNLLESTWVKNDAEIRHRSFSFSHRNTTASPLSIDAIGSTKTRENKRPK